MANNFDRNKYVDSFEKRFGSGAYESGLSNAREIGKAKVEAQVAKAEFDRRIKELEKQQKEAEKKSDIDKLVEEKKASAKGTKATTSTKEKKKKANGNLLSDIGNVTKRAFQAANPFDDVSFGNALMQNATEFDKEKSDAFAETERFSKRATNSTTLGLMENFDKKARGGETPDYMQSRAFGEGGGTDMLADLLGYVTPGIGIASGLRSTKLGAKGVGDLLKSPITKESAKTIAKQTAKEGAAVGAIMSGAEIAGRELLNPDDYNWKQNLAQFGIETTAGAVLDPALTLGVGKLLSKIKKTPTGTGSAQFGPIHEVSPDPNLRFNPTSGNNLDNSTGGSLPRKTNPVETPIAPLNNVNEKATSPRANQPTIDKTRQVETPKANTNNLNQTVDELQRAETPEKIDAHIEVLTEFFEKIVRGLGIRQDSKLSDYVREFGEKRLSLENLKKLAPNDWQRVVEAEKWFQKNHDPLMAAMEYQNKLENAMKYENRQINEKPPPVSKVQKSSVNEMAATTPVNQRPDIDTLKQAYKGKDVPLQKMTAPKSATAIKQADNTASKVDTGRKLELEKEALPKPKDYTEGVDSTLLKDIKGGNITKNDVFRNFDKVFGKNSDVTKRVLGEFDKSKGRYVDMQERLLKELDEKIVKGLGITKGSKLSKYVQDYGEGNMPLGALKEHAPNDWEKVIDADKWFRSKYNELIDEVNVSRALVYPNNPSKQVPKRENYYHHFRELNGLEGLRNIFDTPSAIDPHLAGTSEFTKPGSRFAGFMQKRGLGPYKSDAVGGFLKYVPAASYSKEIDPNIKMFRGLRNELADLTEDSRNLNKFIEFLDKFSNDIAGKTNSWDRPFQTETDRSVMQVLKWVNRRVKSNVILGNLASTLAQLANIPMGIAFAKEQAPKGLIRTLKSLNDKSEAMHKSTFLKERYSDTMYRKFDTRLIEQPQKAAAWLLETSDRVGTSFVWNASYEKGLKEGVSNPIHYADSHTRRMVAGRGVGEVTLAQKSMITQFVAPFTVEVGNLIRVVKDMGREKDLSGLALFFASSFVLNKVMEEIRGSDVTFDPIAATIDALQPGLSPGERVGRVAGEVVGAYPAGQFIAGLYPERGQFGPFDGLTREQFFGSNNPQRFGTGLVSGDFIKDPLFKAITPFGGNQLKKTLNGIETIRDEGQYKDGKGFAKNVPLLGDKDELKYPVNITTENVLKNILFGPGSTDEAKKYFENELRSLGAKQTEEYEEAKSKGVGQEFYDLIIANRQEDKVRRKLKEIQEDETLSDKERKKKIAETLNLLELK